MIKLQANKAVIRPIVTETITAGSRKVFVCEFIFGHDWDGFDRTAVFRAGGVKRSTLLDDDNRCEIPPEVLLSPSHNLEAGVCGTLNGEEILPTIWCSLGKVRNSAIPEEMTEPPPTDLYGHILSVAKNAEEIAKSVRKDADDGAFDGPQGDPGPRGYSGLVPAVSIPWAAEITVEANIKTTIGILAGATSITLGEPVPGYDNEWTFLIQQGETAQDVVLPVIQWHGGYAPVFGPNSRTEVRMWYSGDTLCGVYL